MTGRILFLAGALAVSGLITHIVPRPPGKKITESEMRDLLPTRVEGVDYTQGFDVGETYHMDKVTYDILKPSGIVARVYEPGKEKYDTVIIAGDDPSNFHDPTWCLPGQGWKLGGRHETTVETKTRGAIPVSYFEAENGAQKMLVMYTYRGPMAFHAGYSKLGMDFLTSDFLQRRNRLGAFYRFLSMDASANVEATKRFVASYLDAANESSRGAF